MGNKIQAMYERSRVKVKVERGSTFRETRDLPYIASILFAHVKITCVRALKLRDSRNPLFHLAHTFDFTFFSLLRPQKAENLFFVMSRDRD